MHISAWNSLARFRAERQRCKHFVYGDQWIDPVNIGNKTASERSYYQSMGQNPLSNNILRRILRNVVGLYRSNFKVPTLSAADGVAKGKQLKALNEKRIRFASENSLEALAPRLFEEFLLSGLAVVRIDGSRILPVTPDNFFFNSDGYDPRGWDVDLIGEIHHISFSSLMEKFCRTSDDHKRIMALYGDRNSLTKPCRISEVWSKETERILICHDRLTGSLSLKKATSDTLNSTSGNSTAFCKTFWQCSWIADDGTILRKDPPAAKHPYVVRAYPFIDGEIHSYMGDLIDQQKYVNHLITLYDFIMKSSAKGVLLFPDESLPRGMTLQDVADQWSRFNGVIPYRAQPGVPMPTQVSANSANIGITELLKIEMQLLEDISGVSPTLQGKVETKVTSGTLFAQQNEAAQMSLLDVVRTFDDFIRAIFNYFTSKSID